MVHDEVDPGQAPDGEATARIGVCMDPDHAARFFDSATRRDLLAVGRVTWCTPAEIDDLAAMADRLGGVEILVTAWGVPRIDRARLAVLPELRFVMHAASSLRALTGPDFWSRGLPISQAGEAMAPAVAEQSLMMTLTLLRRAHRTDHALRTGRSWEQARGITPQREIAGCRIGVVGASRTGRRYLAMCAALGASVRVYDPYLPESDPLREVAVELTELVTGSDVIALHAPATSETAGMIDAALIAAMPSGTIVINTARADLCDGDALYRRAAADELDVALDVFDDEPLPVDDRWRALPNVLLTPHIGGATAESRHRAGRIVVDEIRRHLDGRPLQYAVTAEQQERMG